MQQKQMNNWSFIFSIAVFFFTQTAGMAWYFSNLVAEVKHMQVAILSGEQDTKDIRKEIQALIELRYQLERCHDNISRLESVVSTHIREDRER